MARSRTPTRKKAAAKAVKPSSPLDDPNVQLCVGVAILVGLQIASNGVPTRPTDFFGDFFEAQANDFSLPHWPWKIMLTLHVVNKCQNASGGFWIGSLANAVVSAFGCIIVSDFMNNKAQSLLANESHITLAAGAWYFCNHSLPLVNVNAWSKIKGAVGAPLQVVLDVASLSVVTNLVIAAASSSSSAGPLGFSVFAPCVMAVAVGGADEFATNAFAAMKQTLVIKAPTAAMRSALTVALYTCLAPVLLASLPFLDKAYGPVNTFCGGHIVLAAILLNHLVGSFLPASFSPVSQITNRVEGFLNL
jgi:hypothetical protein